MKIFPATARVNEIRCNRARQYRQMFSPIVPLEKIHEAFFDFCAQKTLKPAVKLNP
jgi:hypothetical protein